MNYQQQLANSAAIRAEIQRFESVHPNIYSIYELLERVEEPVLQNQIREHVIAIEGQIFDLETVVSWIEAFELSFLLARLLVSSLFKSCSGSHVVEWALSPVGELLVIAKLSVP
ncbi:hypothetical protein STEG23_022585 [Scotinomys teguina]